ncbi:MAG: hypothetical protein FJ221_10270 [Lentisphaerae bacterium]|nr:hypothetical protein [Lentisphaerota bacterium]
MKALAALLLCTTAMVWACGCNDSGDGGGTPGTSGINLSGSWTGEYTSPGIRIPVQARIRQSGDAVVIQTTKSGVANFLTGTMGPNGFLFMTDSVDAETWTSNGDVTESSFLIRDYLYDPSLGSDSPEQDLILHR